TTPSLAESWTEAKDHLSYTFMLRKGARFHNGEPVTADDVKFSWDRYKGASAKLLKDKVKEVQILDPGQVRFVLREPWPDFITFYGTTASGAGWIVPKKYVEKVGDDGFKAAPIGAGPYKVVSFKPGIEIVLEAFDGYWRKALAVKRLVMRSMPEEATRAAALRAGEVDVVYLLTGPTADAVRKVSGFRLAAPLVSGAFWIELPEQWDPKSPWADQRVRLAASHAIDRAAINQAEMLGFGRLTGNFVPRIFQFAVAMERAAYFTAWRDKKLHGVIHVITAAFGNAATRLEPYVTKSGVYAYGSLPEIDDLYIRQARELDAKKREALVHQIQQIIRDKVM